MAKTETMTLYPSWVLVNDSSYEDTVYTWTDYTNSGTPFINSHGNGTPQNCQLKFSANAILAESVINSVTFNYYVSNTVDLYDDSNFYAYGTNTNSDKYTMNILSEYANLYPPNGCQNIDLPKTTGQKSINITKQFNGLSYKDGVWFLILGISTGWGGSARINFAPNTSVNKMSIVIKYAQPHGNTIGYFDGTNMMACEIYYCDGSIWRNCVPYYGSKSGWLECSTT